MLFMGSHLPRAKLSDVMNRTKKCHHAVTVIHINDFTICVWHTCIIRLILLMIIVIDRPYRNIAIGERSTCNLVRRPWWHRDMIIHVSVSFKSYFRNECNAECALKTNYTTQNLLRISFLTLHILVLSLTIQLYEDLIIVYLSYRFVVYSLH